VKLNIKKKTGAPEPESENRTVRTAQPGKAGKDRSAGQESQGKDN
jgi:hypothetical protein